MNSLLKEVIKFGIILFTMFSTYELLDVVQGTDIVTSLRHIFGMVLLFVVGYCLAVYETLEILKK